MEEASELWHHLMFAKSQDQLDAARMRLKVAPIPLRLAITHAIAQAWRQGQEPLPEQNPFLLPSNTEHANSEFTS